MTMEVGNIAQEIKSIHQEQTQVHPWSWGNQKHTHRQKIGCANIAVD